MSDFFTRTLSDDPLPPAQTSGIRLGSPAATTRGFREAEFRQVAGLIADVLDGLARNGDDNMAVEQAAHAAVRALCARHPLYPAAIARAA